MTHLLRNGHSRCGTPPGHISFRPDGWPSETGVTSNLVVATCPNCLLLSEDPPTPVPPAVARAVEVVKAATQEMPAMQQIGRMLHEGTTIGVLRVVVERAFPPQHPPQMGEA